MSTNFPASIDTDGASGSIPIQPSGTPLATSHIAAHQNEADAIIALETKVGVDSSGVTTSLDYKLKNSGSINPGHLHTLAAGISDVLITSPSDGQVLSWNASAGEWENAGSSAPDASTSVKGVTKMSVAPALSTSPIAVGDNDPRMALPGFIQMYAGASAPTGWLFCDGSSLLRAGTYAALFSAIGVGFGSADGTHFNIPDLRGRAPVGVGTGAGGGTSGSASAPTGGSALTARALGDWLGEETHALSSGELAAHTHTITNQGSHSHSITGYGGSGGSPAIASVGASGGSGSPTIGSSTISGTTDSTGSGTGHNNLQPVLAINFIIKI